MGEDEAIETAREALDNTNERGDDFYVVGIGASAGGLEPLEENFRARPEDTGMAFVIVQHLSPDFKRSIRVYRGFVRILRQGNSPCKTKICISRFSDSLRPGRSLMSIWITKCKRFAFVSNTLGV